ncbi:unnamed protein product [Knipowitschia caucasica]|uniref:DBF4-type domain-containing protein n=1 Tax=Knipowitschia caucasica TaxID=637954 RepID=A0AAV2LFN5_KNICA
MEQRKFREKGLLGKLASGEKKLDGRTFYLDRVKKRSTALLLEAITLFGGKVESFLHKDVSFVVTGCLEELEPKTSDFNDKTANETTPCKQLQSALKKDGPKQATPRPALTACGSRGKALLEKAMLNNERLQGSSVLTNARSWGVRILSADDVIFYLKQLSRESFDPKPKKSEVHTKQNVNVVKAAPLRSPYLKVEDSSRKYKPLHMQSVNFPSVYFAGRYSPFECPPPPRFEKWAEKEEKDIENLKAVLSTEDKCGTPLSGRPSPWRTRKKDSAFCECCRQVYNNQDQHLQSDQHRAFVSDLSNYTAVEELLAAMDPGFDPDPPPQPKELTGETFPNPPALELEPLTDLETNTAVKELKESSFPNNTSIIVISDSVSPVCSSPPEIQPPTTNQSPLIPDPTNQSPRIPDPTNQSPRIPDPTNQSPRIPDPTNQSPRIPDPTNQSLRIPDPTNQSPRIPDPTNQSLRIPDPANQSSRIPDPTNQSLFIPDTTNQNLLIPDLTNQSLLIPDLTNQSLLIPDLTNQSLLIPDLTNQSLLIPDLTNQSLLIPDLTNHSLLIPDLTNHSLLIPDLTNHSLLIPDTTNQSLLIPDLRPPSPSMPVLEKIPQDPPELEPYQDLKPLSPGSGGSWISHDPFPPVLSPQEPSNSHCSYLEPPVLSPQPFPSHEPSKEANVSQSAAESPAMSQLGWVCFNVRNPRSRSLPSTTALNTKKRSRSASPESASSKRRKTNERGGFKETEQGQTSENTGLFLESTRKIVQSSPKPVRTLSSLECGDFTQTFREFPAPKMLSVKASPSQNSERSNSHSTSVCIESALIPDVAALSSSDSDWDCELLSRLGPPPLSAQTPLEPGGELDQDVLHRPCPWMHDSSYETRLHRILQPGPQPITDSTAFCRTVVQVVEVQH